MKKLFNSTIADVIDPKQLSLASNPNFVIFKKLFSQTQGQRMKASIWMRAISDNLIRSNVTFIFNEIYTKSKYTIVGTFDQASLNDKSFLLVTPGSNTADEDVSSTVYNMRSAFLRIPFLRKNFEISVPIKGETNEEGFTEVLIIESKGYGAQYNFDLSIEANENDYEIYRFQDPKLTLVTSTSTDSIDLGNGEQQIELDIYTDTGVVLGQGASEVCETGSYLTSLSKSYFGKPLWFDLNALMGKRAGYSAQFLEQHYDWVDAGTITDYRFVAKRTNNKKVEPFYFSDVLYSINGYDYSLSQIDLNNYILTVDQNTLLAGITAIQPLTNYTQRTHLKGQNQYFNFILQHDNTTSSQIGIMYKLYTQSGVLIGQQIDQLQNISKFSTVNTALLRLDQFLPTYNNRTVGRIEVFLVLNDTAHQINQQIVSQAITFEVLPSCLHQLNDFAFLNRLGGWDSFNFGNNSSTEFKSSASTVYKTVQPNFKESTELESVVSKTIDEKVMVQTTPISNELAQWLRQMSASVAVYELSSKRYVVVDDMTLKYSTKEDLYQVEMKYHYTDTFNTRIK